MKAKTTVLSLITTANGELHAISLSQSTPPLRTPAVLRCRNLANTETLPIQLEHIHETVYLKIRCEN